MHTVAIPTSHYDEWLRSRSSQYNEWRLISDSAKAAQGAFSLARELGGAAQLIPGVSAITGNTVGFGVAAVEVVSQFLFYLSEEQKRLDASEYAKKFAEFIAKIDKFNKEAALVKDYSEKREYRLARDQLRVFDSTHKDLMLAFKKELIRLNEERAKILARKNTGILLQLYNCIIADVSVKAEKIAAAIVSLNNAGMPAFLVEPLKAILSLPASVKTWDLPAPIIKALSDFLTHIFGTIVSIGQVAAHGIGWLQTPLNYLDIDIEAFRKQEKIFRELGIQYRLGAAVVNLHLWQFDAAIEKLEEALADGPSERQLVELYEHRALVRLSQAWHKPVTERLLLRASAAVDILYVLERKPEAALLRAYQLYEQGPAYAERGFELVHQHLESQKRTHALTITDIGAFFLRAGFIKKQAKRLMGDERTAKLKEVLANYEEALHLLCPIVHYSRHVQRLQILQKAYKFASKYAAHVGVHKQIGLAFEILKLDPHHHPEVISFLERQHPLLGAYAAYFKFESYFNALGLPVHIAHADRVGIIDKLNRSIHFGEPEAMAWYVLLHLPESGDRETLWRYIRTATERNCEWGFYVLGVVYEHGYLGVGKDYAEAIKYYKKAEGVPQAYARLAQIYLNRVPGMAVPTCFYNNALGVHYLKKALSYKFDSPLSSNVVAMARGLPDFASINTQHLRVAVPMPTDLESMPVPDKDPRVINQRLFKAAFYGHIDNVRVYLELASDVNSRHTDPRNNVGGKTSLFIALEMGHAEIVRLLLAKGADSRLGDDFGYSPLRIALAGCLKNLTHKGFFAAIDLLIDNLQRIIDPSLLSGLLTEYTQENLDHLLFAAAYHGSTHFLNLLLMRAKINSQHVDFDHHHFRGKTALFIAVERGCVSSVEALLVKGADATIVDGGGWLPFKIALTQALCQRKNPEYFEIVNMLIAHTTLEARVGIAREFSDADLNSLLFATAMHGQRDLVEFLLDMGAAVNSAHTDPNNGIPGKTPLFVAAEKGHPEVVTLLLRRGANKELRDNNGCGWSPWRVAHEALVWSATSSEMVERYSYVEQSLRVA